MILVYVLWRNCWTSVKMRLVIGRCDSQKNSCIKLSMTIDLPWVSRSFELYKQINLALDIRIHGTLLLHSDSVRHVSSGIIPVAEILK